MPTSKSCLFCDKNSETPLPSSTHGVCIQCYSRYFILTDNQTLPSPALILKCPDCGGHTKSPLNHSLDGSAVAAAPAEWCSYSHDESQESTCRKTGSSTTGKYKPTCYDAFPALALAFAKIGEAYDLDTRAKLVETEYEVELEYSQDDLDRQRVLSYGTYDWRSMAFVARR